MELIFGEFTQVRHAYSFPSIRIQAYMPSSRRYFLKTLWVFQGRTKIINNPSLFFCVSSSSPGLPPLAASRYQIAHMQMVSSRRVLILITLAISIACEFPLVPPTAYREDALTNVFPLITAQSVCETEGDSCTFYLSNGTVTDGFCRTRIHLFGTRCTLLGG